MKQNLTISEQMMYSTVRLKTAAGSGTGFFFTFDIDGVPVPTIVTNRHVVHENANEPVSFETHLDGDDIQSLEVKHIDLSAQWFFHPNSDLAICFAAVLYDGVRAAFGKNLFCVPLNEELIATKTKLNELTALEEVTMVGYPQGLSDEAHGLPIFRKGFTASHPAFDFNGKPEGLMDIAGLWGSSGSPIFIFNDNGYTDRFGTTYIGSKRLLFIGIQYAMPLYNLEGSIVPKPIPTDQAFAPVSITQQPMNLAYYIKAEQLLWFKEPIRQLLVKEENQKPESSSGIAE